MNKKIASLIAGAAVLLSAVPVLAKSQVQTQAENGYTNRNNQAEHVYLTAKNPSGWSVIEDGAWGKLTYKEDGSFIFNGHGLVPNEDYSLINFQRVVWQWPASVYVLGADESNDGGQVHIMGTWDESEFDFDSTPGTGDDDGYKVWLVRTSDLTGETLSGWNPANYLFEVDLIAPFDAE